MLLFDPNVRSHQMATLEEATGSVAEVRQDTGLSDEAKRARLLGGLSRRSIDTVLQLSDERWRQVVDEAQVVLGSAMNRSIAPDEVEDVQGGLLQQISANLSADEADLAAELVRPLIVPTQAVDEGAT